MKKLTSELLTEKYTQVFHEDEADMQYNAPHLFKVSESQYIGDASEGRDILAVIHFQEGPIKECGVNGVCNEDLIAMVICRLQHFQKSEFACRDNAVAITKLEEAMMWLHRRTMAREKRGVEGTNKV